MGLVRRLAAVVILACGCAAPEAFDELSVESEHVELFYEPDYEACAGSLAYLETTAVHMATYLGVELASKIEYHLVPPDHWDERPCPDAGGCYDRNEDVAWVRATHKPHELVHAIAGQHAAATAPFLEEGLAVAVGGLSQHPLLTSSEVDNDVPISELLTSELDTRFYATAGDLASYLLHRHGPARFFTWVADAPYDASNETIEDAFASAYAMSIESAIAQRQSSGWSFLGASLAIAECVAEPEPWSGDRWETSSAVECDVNGVGAYAFADEAFRLTSIDIPADGLYRLTGEHRASIGRCLGEQQDIQLSAWDLQNAQDLFAYLHRGRYWLQIRHSAPAPEVLSISPMSQGGTCDDPIEIDVLPGEQRYVEVAPGPSEPTVLRFVTPSAEVGIGTVHVGLAQEFHAGGGSAEPVVLCPRSCAAPVCVEIQRDDPNIMRLDPDTEYLLSVPADALGVAIGVTLDWLDAGE